MKQRRDNAEQREDSRTYRTLGEEWQPAGPGRRVGATLIDMVVFCALSAALAYPVVTSFPAPVGASPQDALTAALSDSGWLHMTLLVLVGWVLLWWVYFVVSWGYFGASPGQRLLGLRLVDHRRRYPIGPARSALRLVAYSVSSALLSLGHLLPVLRRDRRAFHDILAGTQVVRRRRRPRRG